jgi:hypothetical protein
MEDILSILVFLAIFVVAPFINSLKKKKKMAEAEAAAEKAAGGADGEWVEALYKQKTAAALAAKAAAAKLDALKKNAAQKIPADAPQKSPQTPSPALSTLSHTRQTTAPAPLNLSILDAKNGFVWSEILGPPVSLRG